ncbi:MAG: lactate utilization protein [Traorella sp.]
MDIETLRRNCENNRFAFDYVENKEECLALIHSLIQPNDIVSVGGSETLKECGILNYLENRQDIEYLDRYHCEDPHEIFKKAFSGDVYLSSTNALTMQGELYNVDGTGNRIAAMIYGPKKVIIVAGINKIVENIDEAIYRVETIAAIKNNIRLNKDNPCVKVGHCVHCKQPKRICRTYNVLGYSGELNRIHIIVVNEELGY